MQNTKRQILDKMGYVVVPSTYAHGSWQWYNPDRLEQCEGINFSSEQDAFNAAWIDALSQMGNAHTVTASEEQPYIETVRVVVDRTYNPKYGDDRECVCGHPYYRHFDTYESMYPCGCKYCYDCHTFVEKK